MKKLLAMLLAVLMVLSTVVITIMAEGDSEEQPTVDVWDGSVAEGFSSTGTGASEEDPIEITSAAELAYLSALYQAQRTEAHPLWGKHYRLMVDIDLNKIEWTPIGPSGNNSQYRWFEGHFDGNGHTISNVVTAEDVVTGGLFGVAIGLIENLTVAGESRIYGGAGAGAIVGGIHPIENREGIETLTIRNCKVGEDVEVHASNSSSTQSDYGRVGGICGHIYDKGATLC